MGPFWTAGLLLFVPLTSGVLFEYRLRCPDTSAKWKENSDRYICGDGTVYHCMQDQEGRYVVFCAASIWVQPGTVHMYNMTYVYVWYFNVKRLYCKIDFTKTCYDITKSIALFTVSGTDNDSRSVNLYAIRPLVYKGVSQITHVYRSPSWYVVLIVSFGCYRLLPRVQHTSLHDGCHSLPGSHGQVSWYRVPLQHSIQM